MIDYALIVRLRKQGMSINAIASAAGCKWDTVSRILLRCEEKWDSVDNVPDGLGAQEIKDQIISSGSVINREYLQPDPEKILERQRKEGKSRNELWADYCREARAVCSGRLRSSPCPGRTSVSMTPQTRIVWRLDSNQRVRSPDPVPP